MSDEPETPTTEMTPEQRRLANLRPPWRKGESGNPAGKPPGTRGRGTLLREMMNLIALDKDGKPIKSSLVGEDIRLTVEEAMELKQVEKAIEGNLDSYTEIKDTIYGKKVDKTSFTDPEGVKESKNAWTVNIVDKTSVDAPTTEKPISVDTRTDLDNPE